MCPVKLGIMTFGELCVWTVRIVTCLKAMLLQAGIEKLKIKGRVQVMFNPLIQRLPVIAAIKVQIAMLTYRSMKRSGSYGMLCMFLKHSLHCIRVLTHDGSYSSMLSECDMPDICATFSSWV